MTWFGWLTKGHMDVSFLDRLIMLGELIAVGVPIVFGLAWLEVRRDNKRKRARF